MIHLSDHDPKRALAAWLRTGRLPAVPREDGREVKFNPWHDPANGKFTFAGSGRHFGAGAVNHSVPGQRTSGGVGRREPAKRQRVAASVPRPVNRPNPTVEFASGVGEGLQETVTGTAKAVYSVVTTNPATTAGDAVRAIAGAVDAATASEDVPARVRMSRAADALAHVSAHDLGRAVGAAGGNAALAVVPGAALSKMSALRRLRAVGPGNITYEPLQVGWVKENLGRESPAKLYNDTAAGARPNQAPALMRTMPDGSKRPVKFDGIRDEFLIDRKFSVSGKPRARAQVLRQSDVLAQHGLIGIWEVPDEIQKSKAIKMFKKLNVTNIKVKVVKP